MFTVRFPANFRQSIARQAPLKALQSVHSFELLTCSLLSGYYEHMIFYKTVSSPLEIQIADNKSSPVLWIPLVLLLGK